MRFTIKKGLDLPITGGPEQIIEDGNKVNSVVNLGGGRPLSMNYLLEIVGSLTGKKVSFERYDTNLNDARKTMSDPSYIQKLISSKPSTKLEDGISMTIDWASRNEISVNLDKWVKSVK